MLVFPERILAGDLPHKDFLHLYGPGLAVGAGRVVQGARRLASRPSASSASSSSAASCSASWRWRWPWGRRVATAAGVLGVLLTTTAIGLTALAWDGAVALLLVSVWLGLRARRWLTDAGPALDAEARANRLLVAAGCRGRDRPCCSGPTSSSPSASATAGLLAGPGLGPVAALADGRGRRSLALYLVHLLLSGPVGGDQGHVHRAGVRPARRPLAAPPAVVGHVRRRAAEGGAAAAAAVAAARRSRRRSQAFVWFFLLPAATALRGRRRLVAGARRARRVAAPGAAHRRPARPRPHAPGVPAPRHHPPGVGQLRDARLPAGRHLRAAAATCGCRRSAGSPPPSRWSLVALLPLVVIPHFTARTYVDLVKQSANGDVFGYPVTYDGPHLLPGGRGHRARRPADARGDRSADRAGRAAVRRHRRPAQDPVLRRVPLLPAARRHARAPATSRWTRAWPTPRTPAWPTRWPRPTG